MAQSHVARPPQVRSPFSGAVGLMLILAYPLANMIVGMGVVLVPAPRVLSVLGGVVLLAGAGLVIHAGLPQPAHRWMHIAAGLAGLTALAALLGQSELGLSPLRIALAGGSLATLSWGMRCWMQAIADSRGVGWWTAKTVLEVVAAASMSLVGPLNADPTGGTDVALLVGVLAAVVALTRLGVHVGAIVIGLQAFTRAEAGGRGAAPAASTATEPARMPGTAVSGSAAGPAAAPAVADHARSSAPRPAPAPASAGEPARENAPLASGSGAAASAAGSATSPFVNLPPGGSGVAPWPAARGAAQPAAGGSARPIPASPPSHHASRSSRLTKLGRQLGGRRNDGEITWSPPARSHQP